MAITLHVSFLKYKIHMIGGQCGRNALLVKEPEDLGLSMSPALQPRSPAGSQLLVISAAGEIIQFTGIVRARWL